MYSFFKALKQAAYEFIEDDCMSSGAAVAYYSIFALPPLLVIVFLLANYAGVSPERINAVVKDQLGMPSAAVENTAAADSTKGDDSASGLQAIADRAKPGGASRIGLVGRILGVALLIFTATGLFAQLQVALNRAWEVEPDPEKGGVKQFFLKRLLSLGMILVIAFLLLVSMVLSTVITEVTRIIQGSSPSEFTQLVGMVLDNVATFVLGTLLFAAIFKILPDAEMAWRDTWLGAAITAILFIIGKAIIAWYLQQARLGASWGDAAGSIIAVLAWFYYTSLIVLFGAELTQVWAKRFGKGIRPENGAVRAVREKRHVRDGGTQSAR
jgi:membrane protein